MMFEKIKKLFKKVNKVSGDVSEEVDENPIISNVLDYECDYNNQKEIKQIYPNNEDIDVILGFWNNDAIENGHRLSPELVERQIPIDKYVYQLDDTFKFDRYYESSCYDELTIHNTLMVVGIRHKNQRRELLNRWLRKHDSIYKFSPTKYDEYLDNLHDALLVVEHDNKSGVSEDVARYCDYITISRVAIVETPWTRTLVRKNGETVIDTGVDGRLHFYTRPFYEDEARQNYENVMLEEIETNAINNKFDEFLSLHNGVNYEFNQ